MKFMLNILKSCGNRQAVREEERKALSLQKGKDFRHPENQDFSRFSKVKARGQQRTDSTHVVAAVRLMNRLELVGETLRAALNDLAVHAPDSVRTVARTEWYERYQRRSEQGRLPKGKDARESYAKTFGEDGFSLLDARVVMSK
jgi:hypothetical protein